MKVLHENGKIFGKISMVDILVFAIAILLIYGVYSRFNNAIMPTNTNTNNNTNMQEFFFNVQIKNVITETGEMIKQGDKVYDKTSGTEIGEIVEVKIDSSKIDFQTNEGKIIESEIQEKIDIIVKVKSLGNIKNGKYLANHTIDILAGETRQFETKYVTVSSKVLDVYMMEE